MDQALQIEAIVTPGGMRLWEPVEAAAALSVCGFRLHYKKQEMRSEGSRRAHAWTVRERISEAHDLLQRAALTSGPESLIVRTPEHPFVSALLGVRAARALELWFRQPALPPSAVKPSASGRLCTMTAPGAVPDLMKIAWAQPHPGESVAIRSPQDTAVVAAASVCGFLPYPRRTGPDVPHVHLPAESFTFPGLTLSSLMQPALPGAPSAAGSLHPFAVALRAVLRWQQLIAREQQEKRETVLLRSLRGQGVAAVSNQILDTEDPRFAEDRDRIAEHLALA